jgi:hypothetical protein
MKEYEQTLFSATGWIVQFALGVTGFAALFRILIIRRPRWRISIRTPRRRSSLWWYKLWRTDRESTALQERRILLAGCGIGWAPEVYLAYRRSLIAVLAALAMLTYIGVDQGILSDGIGWKLDFALVLAAGLAWYDRMGMSAFRQYRTDRIRREIVAVSSQLLYYNGSRLHLHGKLMRCLPLSRIIRGEMALLLNEWYYDADAAIGKFKQRLGTDEAHGFAECVRSLRLHESDDVYEMLRDIVREYKAKIELAKDSRKETTSYLLFVLSGLPILYTFQIFLYPWVQEAQQLFTALNP